MKKIYCLDTNVLAESAETLFAFEEHEVVIPFTVIIELDELKTRPGAVGMQARRAIRYLDELREQSSLVNGVEINSGGRLTVRKGSGTFASRDDAIVNCATSLANEFEDKEVTLITNDLNMRLKADVSGLKASSFMWEGQPKKFDEIYSGAMRVQLDKETIDKIYKDKKTKLPKRILNEYDFKPNQFIIGKNGDGPSVIAKYRNEFAHLLKVGDKTVVEGLKPRNKEQRFALDVLLDTEISLVSLIGRAGCGKSLMAIAAGLHQVSEGEYKRVIISRPIQAMGKDIGFLPGTLEEKMAPWVQPIKDNMLYLFNGNSQEVRSLFDEGIVEVEALTYIRGRSIPNAYIIIDECQNLSAPEIKAIITRVGEGSKIVLTGDIEQIDNPYFDPMSNGLTYLVEKFKEQNLAAHIKLIKGERSALATLASKIL